MLSSVSRALWAATHRAHRGFASLVRGALADDQLQAGAAAMKAAFADLPDVSEAVPLLEQLAREKTPITQLAAGVGVRCRAHPVLFDVRAEPHRADAAPRPHSS